jgi:hypothetical protein
MNYSFVFIVSASIAVLGSAALAESPGITRQAACEQAAPNQEVIESLRTDAQAVRRELHLLTKGPAANLDKMKVVELDELIDRLQHGDPAAQRPKVTSHELPGPEVNDERAYAIAFLRAYAEDTRNEALAFTKGPAATEYRMKVVELDELIDRLKAGDTVSYEEVDEAMRPPRPSWPSHRDGF